ncbi:MAG: polysaccharide deacetylase family protein [Oscillospiraceae bacterium]|jgi:peptidoglycan/xylan/chitin deacetylase (PgdA/CDA1 family)|nr:polysaccharide deacetylase family protein [Oscillospiraceae bacterium]
MDWRGRMKALTFSYDDGVEQDVRLIDILNRYGMKCTFNLNSGQASPSNSWERGGVTIRRIDSSRYRSIYRGHEPACHALTHPHLEKLSEDAIDRELREDKANLERWFGVSVQGMAYPFGTYDDRVARVAESVGLRYARSTVSTRSFDMPGDLMRMPATCHHKDPALPELIDRFLAARPVRPALFYIWGHSYEFDIDNNWQVIEDACKALAGREDVFYGTNAQTLLG